MSGAYPEGFNDWPLEARNAYFADQAQKYNERKRAEQWPAQLPLQERKPRLKIERHSPDLNAPARYHEQVRSAV